MPDSKTPMVQPSEVIEPQPRSTPPTSAVELLVTVNLENLNLPPASAAANDVPTMPITNQPLLVMVSVSTATQPANLSRPNKVSAPI